MVEQKDISSPLLMEVPKSQLTAKQPMTKTNKQTKKLWNLPKELAYIQRQRSCNQTVKGCNHDQNEFHTLQVGESQTGK